MSMLSVTGNLMKVFTSDKGVSKKTGEEYGGQSKIQIMGEIPLQSGETKFEMLELSTHDKDYFAGLENKKISIPVGAFGSGKDVIFFIPKGSKPQLVQSQVVTKSKSIDDLVAAHERK